MTAGRTPADVRRSPNAPGRRARAGARRVRIAVVAALTAVVAVAYLVLHGGGPAYVVNAQFSNAGQLVVGGRVEVAGATIGTIDDISITRNGQANVRLRITDDRFVPFRRGTRLAIRSVGQATITNRYVDVGPGPSNAPALADGAVVPPTETAGIVDLDQILDAIDAPTRKRIQGLIANASQIYAGSSARTFNAMLGELEPALSRVGDLASELASDQAEIRRLVTSGAQAATTVATRHDALRAAVGQSQRTFAAVADQRAALEGTLEEAPAFLRRTGATLRRAGATVADLRPTLRAVPPVKKDLEQVLTRFPVALDRARPMLESTSRLLKPLAPALSDLVQTRGSAVGALDATKSGLQTALPMFEGLRFYGSDVLLGVVNGLMALATGGYNEQGHYIKAEFVQSPQTALAGLLSPLLPSLTSQSGIVPGVLNTLTRQNDRCPGSSVPPAPDGSSPWFPKPGICDPSQSISPLVNSPTAFCRTANDCVEPGSSRSRRKSGGR